MGDRMARRQNDSGFTLLEMMIVVLLLMVVTGTIFSQINSVQQRYRQEEMKLDITQAAREAMDNLINDMHQAGYPTQQMFSAGTLGSPATDDPRVAVGLVAVSSRDLWFEADLNMDGVVESVRYQLTANASGNCPCTLRRSEAAKTSGAPTSQALSWGSQVENVVNSGSSGGALTISGSMTYGGTSRTNDSVYSAYKGQPVFRYFNSAGAEITVPSDLAGGNLTTGSAAALLTQISSVRVTFNVLSPEADMQNRMRPAVSITAVATLNN